MKVLLLALLPAVAIGQLWAGGITDTQVSATYEPVVFAVKAINEMMARNSGTHNHQLGLLEVVRARTQVVAGQKLYLTLHMSENYYCDVTVWYRAWLNGDERLIVTDGPTCSQQQPPAPAVGGVPGGISEAKHLPVAGDNDHDSVLGALNFAACELNNRVNSMFAATLGDVSEVTYTQQVTAGLTYRFYNVPMVPTGCRNQGCANLDLKACTPNVHGQKMRCNFTVQWQAWMNPQYTLTNLSC